MEFSGFAFMLFDLAKEQGPSNQKVACFLLQSVDMDAVMVTTHSNYSSTFLSFYLLDAPRFIYSLMLP